MSNATLAGNAILTSNELLPADWFLWNGDRPDDQETDPVEPAKPSKPMFDWSMADARFRQSWMMIRNLIGAQVLSAPDPSAPAVDDAVPVDEAVPNVWERAPIVIDASMQAGAPPAELNLRIDNAASTVADAPAAPGHQPAAKPLMLDGRMLTLTSAATEPASGLIEQPSDHTEQGMLLLSVGPLPGERMYDYDLNGPARFGSEPPVDLANEGMSTQGYVPEPGWVGAGALGFAGLLMRRPRAPLPGR